MASSKYGPEDDDMDKEEDYAQKTETFTCYFCNTSIVCEPDGKLRACACGCLQVDHTKYYTRLLGTKPLEQLNQEELEKYAALKEKHFTSEKRAPDT